MMDCEKCLKICSAACCGLVAIPQDVLLRNKHKLKRQIIVSDGIFGPIGRTADGICPFLNAELKCEIYADRPDVCRKFGDGSEPFLDCEYMDKDGDIRSEDERKAIVQAREDYTKTLFQKNANNR